MVSPIFPVRIKRSSGTVITPTFGSIVQKGKFAACAFALLNALNKVDFPTFGNPTMPACKAIVPPSPEGEFYVTMLNNHAEQY